MSLNIDKADNVLGIMLKYPDKLNRQMLNSLHLDPELFIFDESQKHLYASIISASYLNNQVNSVLLDSYATKYALSPDLREDLVIAFKRAQSVSLPFSSLIDAAFAYLTAVRSYKFQELLLFSNTEISKGTSLAEIIIKHRAELDGILASKETLSVKSVKTAASEFIAYYEAPKNERTLYYNYAGIDRETSGIMPGEVHTLAAFSGEGKSMILLNIGYNNILKGMNIFLSTLEMTRTQYMMRLFSLHSLHPRFGSSGLPYKKIKDRELDPIEQELLYQVISDLAENPEYGQMYFATSDGSLTPEDLFAEAADLATVVPIHGVLIDYIALLAGKGSKESMVIANNYKTVKQKAISFKNGAGVPVISVHQISEDARKKAEETGNYNFNFLADTSEVRKSSDCVIWFLRTQAHKEVHEIGGGIAKLRDGAGQYSFSLFEKFEFCQARWIDSELV